jgi:hypothetical protein
MAVTGVIDVRAFPMEIAKHMLMLGYALSMSKGPTAYYEAENKLLTYLEALSIYATLNWSNKKDFRNQQRFAERFVAMHRDNPNLLESQARQLLDSMGYFPNAGTESKS